jgi:hypothetical protein
MSEDIITCPKCKRESGDNWSECEGSCPMPMSPYYNKAAAAKYGKEVTVIYSDDVSIRVWTKRGNMLIKTDALDFDDPEHPYNQLLEQGVKPEDYGYKHPLEEEFGDKSRGELVAEIVRLRREILAREQWN